MNRSTGIITITVCALLLFRGAALCGEGPLRLTDEESDISIVTLKGKINHFGSPDFHAVVPGVRVWIAEFPATRDAEITSDETGWWSMEIIKRGGEDLNVSFIYEKQGWVTTKSNVITVADGDIDDLAIQFIDPDYYYKDMKPLTGKMLSAMMPAGADAAMKNAMVVTVGKPWASMHDDRLPHGEPGATATLIPGAIGPIYFDESVRPNPFYKTTSVDGGVAWINVPAGVYSLGASKQDMLFKEVKFVVDESDEKNGVELYIASPPYSVQGIDKEITEWANMFCTAMVKNDLSGYFDLIAPPPVISFIESFSNADVKQKYIEHYSDNERSTATECRIINAAIIPCPDYQSEFEEVNLVVEECGSMKYGVTLKHTIDDESFETRDENTAYPVKVNGKWYADVYPFSDEFIHTLFGNDENDEF